MIRFKQFLSERFKSADEDKIRLIASQVRRKLLLKAVAVLDKKGIQPRCKLGQMLVNPHRMAEFGDCDWMSDNVAAALQRLYPSAKIIEGKYLGTGHVWVEIPELGLFVDPSFDQFGKRFRDYAPTVQGRFPDNLVKVGRIGGKEYENYHKLGQKLGQGLIAVQKPQDLLTLLGDD